MTEVHCLYLGEYDEQQLLGVFSTKEKAEYAREIYLASDRWVDDVIQIESYELDAGVDLLQSGQRIWVLESSESGEILEASTIAFRYEDFNMTKPEFFDRKISHLSRHYYEVNDIPFPRFYAKLWASSKEEAIQKLDEFRDQAMAND